MVTTPADEVADLLERLAGIPARIERALVGWEEAPGRARPAADAWSVAEVMAHLRAADDIISPRYYAILVRDVPPLPAFDERRWASVAGYPDMAVPMALVAYARRRAELIAMLRRVELGDWMRTGQHEERGEISLLDILRAMVAHEEEHAAEIERLISAPAGSRA